MSSEKYTAICLNAIDYKENDKLLTLYARGKGKLTATLRGCKSPKSKLKVAGQPMCLGEYEFGVTRGRYVVTGISDAEIFTSLWADIDKFYIGMTMLEVFNKFTYENEVYDEMFLELLKSLSFLSKDNLNPYLILSHYLFRITSLTGYAPHLDGCIKCGDTDMSNKKFSYIDGGLVCKECDNGVTINDEVLQILLDIEQSELEEIAVYEYQNANILNVIYLFNKYLEHILGEKVRSLCQFLDNIAKKT